ncbi:hypothetical protein PUN28_010636 [Cardiocondyla obscurior]|uniref:Uncharacterized protein n=1 Tax=Cardiocondyla obscurior TaxID=286306 RepID=A0AAW2FGR8_9HYME
MLRAGFRAACSDVRSRRKCMHLAGLSRIFLLQKSSVRFNSSSRTNSHHNATVKSSVRHFVSSGALDSPRFR